MQIKIIAVGKLREKFLRLGIAEYQKRLSAHCRLEIVEVKDESFRESELEATMGAVLDREADNVLRELPSNTYTIVLDVSGDQVTSEEFSRKLSNLALTGKSNVTFVIGGTLGLSDKLREKADWRLSLSHMTLPHQLARLVLAEQLYRAFTIMRNEPYHR